MAQRDFIVLSLDGGGVRGIIPAVVLERLQRDLQKKLCDNNLGTELPPFENIFDAVVGTSAGGLIALAMSVPFQGEPCRNGKNIVDLYVRFAKDAFRPPAVSTGTVILSAIGGFLTGIGVASILHEQFRNTVISLTTFACNWLFGITFENFRIKFVEFGESLKSIKLMSSGAFCSAGVAGIGIGFASSLWRAPSGSDTRVYMLRKVFRTSSIGYASHILLEHLGFISLPWYMKLAAGSAGFLVAGLIDGYESEWTHGLVRGASMVPYAFLTVCQVPVSYILVTVGFCVMQRCNWQNKFIPYFAPMPSSARKKLLASCFPDIGISQAVIPVLVTGYNATANTPEIFRSHVDKSQISVLNAAEITSAAPTYWVLPNVDGLVYVDGGVFANCPAIFGYGYAKQLLQASRTGDQAQSQQNARRIKIISLGTGKHSVQSPSKNAGILFSIIPLFDILFQHGEMVELAMKGIIRDEDWYRLNPLLKEKTDLADYRKMETLIQLVNSLLDDKDRNNFKLEYHRILDLLYDRVVECMTSTN